MKEKNFYVYMLASRQNGTIYKGVTSDLVKRIGQHKFEKNSQFTSQYNVKRLVWYKACGNWEDAIAWEKRLRRYPRQWKINLIEEVNPDWVDLWNKINGLHGRAVQ
jgi:putative endonuclease